MEFLGFLAPHDGQEIQQRSTGPVDLDYLRRLAAAQDEAGFDRVLIGNGSAMADGAQLAAFAAAYTSRLGFLIAHRPGFVAPTVFARTIATLDALSGGRTAVHIITGGSDADQRRDGDRLPKEQRYARTGEFVEIVKRVWTTKGPLDHHGEHYQVEGIDVDVFPVQRPRPRIYFAGSSAAGIATGARVADAIAFYGEPLRQTREQIGRIRAVAAEVGRTEPLAFNVSVRPIIAPTDAAALEKAERITSTIERNVRGGSWDRVRLRGIGDKTANNEGSDRLREVNASGALLDRAYWTGTSKATNASGISSALVGSPETVASAVADYVELGVTSFLFKGWDLLGDARDYGRHLLPVIRDVLRDRGLDHPTLPKASAS
ncbi:LLM class flavin-dependent oxidoreductase [Prauserella sp. ASG 168]|uniref:LLM class flavin-dependent oxidoreductase n=1 Tax=Prauserella cavernicola TaxID=2800127 RepID=A0A934QPI0_9PSEU|nr:LLM class flavin-dependent oxidoreductase [Prauserella cavernicola]